MSNQLESILNKVQEILIQTWQETGFGHLEIDSTKINKNKIQLIIKSGIFYKYVINIEDLPNSHMINSVSCDETNSEIVVR
jgi:hypothetical protein